MVTAAGSTVTVEYHTTPGSDVTAQIFNHAGTPDAPPAAVAESEPGLYVTTFTPDHAGVWRVAWRSVKDTTTVTKSVPVAVADPSGGVPYATAETIAEMWRPLSGDDTERAEALCGYASAVIRTRVSHVDARIAAGTLSPAVVGYVCASMVLRVMRNPSGVAAETVGPWSVTYGSTGTQATGALYLTEEDLALLRGAPVGTRAGHARAVLSANPFVSTRSRWRAWGAER